ncbi:MAG: hypothetical protein IMZ61_13865 [Planctomycetes bacterium]|nr:hypothetical protein [Chloroflexota bacterium]MBE3144984.1 hypothetical protein [Planctomycetota bacterium]
MAVIYGEYLGKESPLDDAIQDNEDLVYDDTWTGGEYQITNFTYGGYPADVGQKCYQAFTAESTYILKITRAFLFRNGEGGNVPTMTAKLYLADANDRPTGSVLMQTTLEGWSHISGPPTFIGNWADINWKDGSIKDYEVQSGTKYVIEISSAALSYYSGFLEDWMGWCANDNMPTYPDISNQYYWDKTHAGSWWSDAGYICLFRNFGPLIAPEKAIIPGPTSGTAAVPLGQSSLSWVDGGLGEENEADTFNVYYGTSSGSLTLISSGQDAGEISNLFSISGVDDGSPFGYAATRYWRIDSIGIGGTTTGDVWVFTTRPVVFDLPPFPPVRPDDYDPDLPWVPGDWTPGPYTPPDWGDDTIYVAAGGGRWNQQLVVAGHNLIYYEAL